MRFKLDCIEGENIFSTIATRDVRACNYLKSKGVKFEDASVKHCIQLIEYDSHIMYDQFIEISDFKDFKELIDNIPHIRINRICEDIIEI